MLVDTHSHIHDPEFKIDAKAAIANAKAAGVTKIICVGTSAKDSAAAVDFVQKHTECYATVGLHPHDAKLGKAPLEALKKLISKPRVVAVGECGLDYYYNNSPKADQAKAFRTQIELALKFDKPLVFHVREAFADFFKILDDYQGIRGVVHSFSSDRSNLDKALEHGLHVAFNGIMTFSKDEEQLAAAKAAPLDKMVLETDTPFLTPVPFRGKVNEPANTKIVAEFLANLRGESFEDLAQATTDNAFNLFGIL